MPLLKFQCAECEAVFEELVLGQNVQSVRCPQCKSAAVERYYQGKCYFGMAGSSAGSACAGKDCATCPGCGKH